LISVLLKQKTRILFRMLKERNNELFQENLRLQHGQSNIIRRSSNPEQQVTFSSQSKLSNSDSKHFKSK